MDTESFTRARQYAADRLDRELPAGLFYHGLMHTRSDVVPATERFADGEGVEGEDRLMLLTAAWFHDLGFVEVRAGREAVGARIAAEALPGFGYADPQILTIRAIIMATAIPQSFTTLLEKIMADADLDVLGRDDFLLRNGSLRRELAFLGQKFSDAQWFSGQLKFVESHSYFTTSARQLRDAAPGEKRHGFEAEAGGIELERQAGRLRY